ncbi:MAG TPA: HAMP domain-containing sensor histidine kinase [Vicinamibacteria bacterium]|nr:HAMP domain-containing sensor histidine kinase [Vicinamibacteria bacterium]
MTTPTISTPSWRARAEGLALLAVIGLLGVLAVIQHQWLGAIAEAERRKLTEEATEKAAAIAAEVDRELTRAFLELRIDARMLESGKGSAFAGQVERFRAESAHQAMVKDVFVAERSDKAPTRLLRFDPLARDFQEVEWPESLAPVRAAVDADGEALSLSGPLNLPPVMADVPALLSPVINVIVREKSAGPDSAPRISQIREMFMRHSGRGPVEILLLDDRYLREALVGSLASARLGSDGPFVWSVAKSVGGGAVAGTEPLAKGTPDATAPLLRLRFDELDRSLLRGVLPGLSEVVNESSVRLVVQMAGPGTAVHLAGSGPSSAPWTLMVRHREGSIDAAVRSQQRRNTALSASILGVLGLSAGLVFFSARRLQKAAAQQVEFVAAVSHELRTPLAVIRSAADNLADGVVQDKDQAKRYGSLIRDESVRLTDMVEHVLEFAGADSPARAARGPVDAVEAARAAVLGMATLVAERNARVEIEAPDEALRVNGDLSHLTRAISNLIGNALKYGGDAPRVTIRVQRAGEGVTISVADQGSGLAASEIPRLFEPFYRGRRASEAQIPGSGLGLALVKRIVESHGGGVKAANGPGGGALFTIELPAA